MFEHNVDVDVPIEVLNLAVFHGPEVSARNVELGTMENLLAMPTRPFEVMIGKIIPYILVGYVQVALILIVARVLFHVPMLGNLGLLLVVALVFIAANLAVGITFSTVAQNQLQAMQMSFFFLA